MASTSIPVIVSYNLLIPIFVIAAISETWLAPLPATCLVPAAPAQTWEHSCRHTPPPYRIIRHTPILITSKYHIFYGTPHSPSKYYILNREPEHPTTTLYLNHTPNCHQNIMTSSIYRPQHIAYQLVAPMDLFHFYSDYPDQRNIACADLK